jgi:hypothetical protein
MPATYTCAVRTPAAAAGATYCDLRTTSTDRARIREIGVSSSAATLSSLGLIRSATIGTTSTTTIGQAQEPGEAAGTVLIGTAWSSAPTISTNVYLRRFAIPATAGAGVIWTWPYDAPLVVPVSASILLWNFGAAAGAACDVYWVWEE